MAAHTETMTTAAHYPSNPPLPYDWSAWYVEEDRGEYGYGPTREAAIEDLLANYPR